MARSLSGTYQPRCAVEDPDAAFLDNSSSPRRKAAPNRFLRGAVKLQQTFTDMTILDAVPDVMGGKTAVTFVDKRTFKALLLLCTPKSNQPVLGFIGMGG